MKQISESPQWDFDFEPYKKRFLILKEGDCAVDQIGSVYLEYVKKLIMEGRIGTALSYQCSYVSIKKFRGNVRFSDITVSFLTQYEQFMLSKNISKSTVGIYLRPLRCIFNEAIAAEIIEEKRCYPFGKRKYQIPTSKNVKKALDTSDLSKIFYYQTDNESQQKSKDFWLFSYLGNGMNIKDIALLKFGNIHGEYLVFERSKTERTMRSDPKPISIFLTDDMLAIINRWGNKDKHVNSYIFPILVPGLNSLRVYELVQGFIHFMNENMAIVKSNLNIDKKVTTYVARHTFSTVLKRSGVSTEYIQEALGHTDIKTTENYLDSFGKDMKKEFASKLTAFKASSDMV
jgi:integrase